LGAAVELGRDDAVVPEIAIERISQAMRLSPNDPQTFSFQAAKGLALFIAGRY
jgi:hypothetical protein